MPLPSTLSTCWRESPRLRPHHLVRTDAVGVVVVGGGEVEVEVVGALDVVVDAGVVVETGTPEVVVVSEGISRGSDFAPLVTTNARTPRTATTKPTATETLVAFDTCGS